MRKLTASLCFLLCAGSVHAGLFDDDVARQQITELKDQLTQQQRAQQQLQGRVEILEAGNKQVLELVRQLSLLREENAKLNGQIEVLQFKLDEAAKRQKDLYVDLDQRLRNLEKGSQEASQQAQQREQSQFDAAVALVKRGSHKEALAALDAFRNQYPQSKLSSSVRYWQGVSLLASKNYKAASAAFGEVANNAKAELAPDALLGLASVATASNDRKAARKYLLELVDRFPDSAAAETARKALAAQ